MATYSQTSCTLSTIRDVKAVYTYYHLASSTIDSGAAPKDGVNVPGANEITVTYDGVSYKWTLTEPTLDIDDGVIRDAIGQLYYIECAEFTDSSYDWGPMMTSSTYAAAKAAYNLSSQAKAATDLMGGHFIYKGTSSGQSTPAGAGVIQTIDDNPANWGYNTWIGSNGIQLRRGEVADATLSTNGLVLSKGGIESGGLTSGDGYVYLSTLDKAGITINGYTPGTNDPKWRAVIGSKFGVDSEGNLYANNVRISGVVNALSGTIGGWNIGIDTNKSLYTGNFGEDGGIYISPSYTGILTISGEESQNWAFTAGNAFGVTTDGKLYASGAEIAGAITTRSLTIESNATISDSNGLIRNDAIEVGGTNMLGNTSNPSGTEIISNVIAAATFGSIGNYNDAVSLYGFEDFDGHSNSIKWTSTGTGNRGVAWYTKVGAVKASTEYTFSCKVKSTVATTVHTHTAWRNGSATSGYTGWTSEGSVSIAANTWTDYSCTFKPNSNAKLDWEFLVALCFTGISSGATFYVAHAKLEKGNKVTDWSPAPEDLETRVAATEGTIEGMPTKVSDFEDAENYTLKTTFDELNKYVNTHMVLSNGELSILADNVPSRIKLGLEGLSIYGPNGIMAQYGENAIIGDQNGFHIKLSEIELSFFQGKQKVAYISNNQLYITQSVVLERMDLGTPTTKGGLGQWSWKVHEVNSANNLYLKWLG